MNSWAQRHLRALERAVGPDNQVRAAERVLATDRRRQRAVPRTGFIVVVTDEALFAVAASPVLARPRHVVAEWRFEQGATLASAPLGRLRLVLPDRTVVTLRPFGLRRISHLAR